MSDKQAHAAMHRRTLDSLAALAAGIIAFTGQCYLIIPHLLGGLGNHLPTAMLIPGSVLFFITGWFLYSSTTFEQFNWKARIIFGLGALCLSALLYLYLRAGLLFHIPLLASILVALIASGLLPSLAGRDTLSLVALASNLTTGGLLLSSNRFPTLDWNPDLPVSRTWMAGLFLASGLIVLAATRVREPNWKGILAKLGALPWLGWLIVHDPLRNLSGFILTVSFTTILLIANFIPWEKFKLPQSDVLGRRMLAFTGIVETAILIGFTYLIQSTPAIGGDERAPIFLILLLTQILFAYALVSLLVTINKLTHPASPFSGEGETAENESLSHWEQRIARLSYPFTSLQTDRESQLGLAIQQLGTINKQLESEKRRSAQLILLSELSQQLEAQLDPPVSAQLAVNTLHRSIHCSFAALYLNDPERRELVVLAVAGTRANMLPPGYHQPVHEGLLGRTVRQRKTQIVGDSRLDPDFVSINQSEDTLSLVTIPLIDHGHMKGVLEISDARLNAFSSHDIQIAEAAARELLRAWERSDYHQRLTELIRAGISLTTQPDPQAAVQEVANIARQTLRARFTFVTLLDQEGNFTRVAHAGHAPRLFRSISQQSNRETLVQSALNAERPFRIRDIRKYKRASRLDIDFSGLRSLIAIPIRMHGLSVGAMLAFGKQGEVFFTENDESLASLLSSQASAAIESAWLSYELRTSLATITQLYQLSFHVIQAEELKDAAAFIADAALKLCDANATGIILFSPEKQVEAEVQLDKDGNLVQPQHPMEIIHRAIESQQSIILSTGQEQENICFPIKTRRRTFGAIWLTVPSQRSARFITNLQTLVNQAGVALERSILLVESRQQAKAIEAAYQELENAYDHTLEALMSSLDARDRETEGHSVRVAQMAGLLGEAMNVTAAQRKALERGSLLHDIGKIGISDTILHKPGPLSEAEWMIMRQHPDIGARIVEGIPFLQDTLPIIRYHQERWDGSGYPIGLSGKDIPLLARIFAVADAFDALTSDRPYRNRIGDEEALNYLKANAGTLFDPEIVSALMELHTEGLLAGLTQA